MDVIWNENVDVSDSSDERIVGFVLIFTHTTAATVQRAASVLYLVFFVLMSFTYGFRRWLIETDHAVVGFMHVIHSIRIYV